LYGRQQANKADRQWWNQRAGGFYKPGSEKTVEPRLAHTLKILEQRNLLQSDFEALDIGSGPGDYALELARRVKKVVALDPAPQMLNILQQRAAQAGIINIETVCLTWEEINLVDQGWAQSFDLVFASLTPGIHDRETLEKMMAASRRACFYKGFAWREDPTQKELWQRWFQNEIPPVPADVFYVFHLLYAWGFCPSLDLQHRSTRRTISVDEAIHDLTLMMSPTVEISEARQAEINKVIGERSDQGIFHKEINLVEGSICWELNA